MSQLYFKNRQEAGRLLADKLAGYSQENCAVLALNEGGVLVALEVAKRLHASLYFLVMENIVLPRESEPMASMSSGGTFTYNRELSPGQLDAMNADYRPIIDQERLEAFHKLNQLVGKDGVINKELLKRHVVILISDGFGNGLTLDVAADFIKPIAIKKLVVATPIANIKAVDIMHLLADDIYCLGTTDNYFNTDHYYEENEIPDHKTVVELIKNNVFSWQEKGS